MAKAAPTLIISHWYNLVENLQASPMQFYAAVIQAIYQRRVPHAEICRVDFPEGGMFSARREYLRVIRGRHVFDICGAPFGTGFFVSWWLGETRSSLGLMHLMGIIIGIGFLGVTCFGVLSAFVGFFQAIPLSLFLMFIGLPFIFWFVGLAVSKSQMGFDDFLMEIPLIGLLYERLFRPITYYRIDTALMFQEAIHSAVMEAIDYMTQSQGIRPLTELERKPIMREFYQSYQR